MDEIIAKVAPQIDKKAADKMEKDMNGRFNKVSSRFSSGMKKSFNLIKNLGLIATGAILATMTQPIKQADDAINRTLQKADLLQTSAGQFGAKTGSYTLLASAAKTMGIDEAMLQTILTRFNFLFAKAKTGEKTGNRNVLSQFTKTDDTALAFVQVIDSLQKVSDKAERDELTAKIFGTKGTGKLAELLQSDIMKRFKDVSNGKTSDEIGKAVDKLASLEEQQAILKAQMDIKDLLDKANVITSQTIKKQAEGLQKDFERENINIENYNKLKDIETFLKEAANKAMYEITNIDESMKTVAKEMPKIVSLLQNYLPTSKESALKMMTGGGLSNFVAGMVGKKK